MLEDRKAEFDDIARRHGVPGASLAVCHAGETSTLVTGIANVNTGIAVTPQTAFQIGSITKPITATMALILQEQGLLGISDPVGRFLPELLIAHTQVGPELRIAHLLDHSSGLDGDFMVDTDWHDGCLRDFERLLSHAARLFPAGAHHAYCNSGYMLMGRLIEVVTELIWDTALEHMVLKPLATSSAFSRLSDTIKYHVAIGHRRDTENGQVSICQPAYLPRSTGPAGGTLTMSAEDLLRFGIAHMDEPGDEAAAGLLTPESKQVMRTRRGPMGQAWVGLGWGIRPYAEHGYFLAHQGSTVGQDSLLMVEPTQGFAISLLTNLEDGLQPFLPMIKSLASDLAGLPLPAGNRLSRQSGEAPAAADCVGLFRAHASRIEIREAPQGLEAEISQGDRCALDEGSWSAPHSFPLAGQDRIHLTFRDMSGDGTSSIELAFLDLDGEGRPQGLIAEGRYLRRADG